MPAGRAVVSVMERASGLVGWGAQWWAAHWVAVVCVGVLGGGLAAGTWAWWRRQVRQALEERVRVVLVPADGFDPSLEEIGWFADQLAQVPAAAGAVPRRAAGVRMRLFCEGGQLGYAVEGPERAAALLRTSAYADVEVGSGQEEDGGVPGIRFEGAPPLKASAGEKG
ncbi:hypothetical protein H3147_05810 [Streptomyces sp. OF8]|uniref:Uncharacterized protein n=1 Tax=Streptomyces alkaliterrae TaxID=2213162 RepID=A0A7W3WUC5_9ACTN|nr:hypothetical protein [Streptomyces alkaliterrae]